MRLLFYYPPHHLSGSEELCQEVAEGLTDRGHTVTVLTGEEGTAAETASETSGRIPIWRRLPLDVRRGDPFAAVHVVAGGAKRGRQANAMVRASIQEHRPVAVVFSGLWNLPWSMALAAESSGTPTTYYIADYWPALESAAVLLWRGPARRMWLTSIKRVLAPIVARGVRIGPQPGFPNAMCVSGLVRRHLEAQGLPFGHAVVVNNEIDAPAFAVDARHALANPVTTLRVLFAGRIHPSKGPDVAIDALNILVQRGLDVTLTIMGGGAPAYVSGLRGRISRAGLEGHVVLAGRVPRAAQSSALAMHDVLVVPSRWPDALPRIVEEGMAARMVVVATDIGGIPEIVRHAVTGLLVPSDDPMAFADALQKLHESKGLRRDLADAGYDAVTKSFTIGRMLYRRFHLATLVSETEVRAARAMGFTRSRVVAVRATCCDRRFSVGSLAR